MILNVVNAVIYLYAEVVVPFAVSRMFIKGDITIVVPRSKVA